jgi:hypothetical protein
VRRPSRGRGNCNSKNDASPAATTVSLQTILEVVRSPDRLRAWPESQHRDDTVGHYQTRDESILANFLWGTLGIYTMTVDFILSESVFGSA